VPQELGRALAVQITVLHAVVQVLLGWV